MIQIAERLPPRSFVRGLRGRECARSYEKAPVHVCEFCFGPLAKQAVLGRVGEPALIGPRLAELDALVQSREEAR